MLGTVAPFVFREVFPSAVGFSLDIHEYFRCLDTNLFVVWSVNRGVGISPRRSVAGPEIRSAGHHMLRGSAMSQSVLTLCVLALLAPSAGADDGASILRKYAAARSALDRVSATYRYAVEQVVYQGAGWSQSLRPGSAGYPLRMAGWGGRAIRGPWAPVVAAKVSRNRGARQPHSR